MRKLDSLNIKELLEKNPATAKVFEENQRKLSVTGRRRQQKEYAIGLPYGRSPLSSNDFKCSVCSEILETWKLMTRSKTRLREFAPELTHYQFDAIHIIHGQSVFKDADDHAVNSKPP